MDAMRNFHPCLTPGGGPFPAASPDPPSLPAPPIRFHPLQLRVYGFPAVVAEAVYRPHPGAPDWLRLAVVEDPWDADPSVKLGGVSLRLSVLGGLVDAMRRGEHAAVGGLVEEGARER